MTGTFSAAISWARTVVLDAPVAVQLLAAHNVQLVNFSFPFRRRLLLVRGPQVQGFTGVPEAYAAVRV